MSFGLFNILPPASLSSSAYLHWGVSVVRLFPPKSLESYINISFILWMLENKHFVQASFRFYNERRFGFYSATTCCGIKFHGRWQYVISDKDHLYHQWPMLSVDNFSLQLCRFSSFSILINREFSEERNWVLPRVKPAVKPQWQLEFTDLVDRMASSVLTNINHLTEIFSFPSLCTTVVNFENSLIL